MTTTTNSRRRGGVWWWIIALLAVMLLIWFFWAWGWGSREPLTPVAPPETAPTVEPIEPQTGSRHPGRRPRDVPFDQTVS